MERTGGVLRRLAVIVALAGALAVPVRSAGPAAKKEPVGPAFADDLAFLRAHGAVDVLSAPSGAQVVVSAQYQGRVMTSAVAPDGRSLGWINRAFISAGKTGTPFDNYRGEDRFWLAAEGGQFALYFAPGKPFACSERRTPAAFQEGARTVNEEADDELVLARSLSLGNYSGTRFSLDVERTVRLLPGDAVRNRLGINPGTARTEGARWVAFETVNRITNRGTEAWTKERGLLSVW